MKPSDLRQILAANTPLITVIAQPKQRGGSAPTPTVVEQAPLGLIGRVAMHRAQQAANGR